MKKEESLMPFALLLNVVYFCIFWAIHQLLATELSTKDILVGNLILWLILVVSILLVTSFCKIFRLSIDHNVPLLTNILIVVLVLLFSSCFIAWHTQSSFENLTLWKQRFLHVFGFLYAYLAFAVVTSFYTGNIFKILGLAVALISYLVFAFSPNLTAYLASFI